MYNCSRNTMTRICREAGVHTRRYLRKMEVEKVFELIGEPESFEQ